MKVNLIYFNFNLIVLKVNFYVWSSSDWVWIICTFKAGLSKISRSLGIIHKWHHTFRGDNRYFCDYRTSAWPQHEKLKKNSNVTLSRGRIRNSVTKCHMGERGGLKSAKKVSRINYMAPYSRYSVKNVRDVINGWHDLKIASWMKHRG